MGEGTIKDFNYSHRFLLFSSRNPEVVDCYLRNTEDNKDVASQTLNLIGDSRAPLFTEFCSKSVVDICCADLFGLRFGISDISVEEFVNLAGTFKGPP